MFYYIIRAILIPFLFLLFFPKITGKENLPKEGSVIIYSNHTSFLDPILLGCVLPRRIYFMAKQELFRFPPLAYIIRALGAFPVKRGTADITAIKKALQTLKEGKVFGIFPEGTRSKSGDLKDFNHGIAAIAQKSRAITIPVIIKGNYKVFRQVRVIIGKPLDLHEYYGQKPNSELLTKMSDYMTEAIKSLASESENN
ncbi:MAG TPA: 1-acyl-sn-glycerol-3-phosphate acyltransferase [Clostridiales bacterium]|nr:1-acyl-sn-glycerol-3-phosphate acyltransferase [Clostridiales bacterium]